MIINYENKNIINDELSVHDAVFTGFNYDYKDKTINFQAREYYGKTYYFKFLDILSFSMQADEPWSSNSPRILEWYLTDSDDMDSLQNWNQTVKSTFRLSSGDTLTISCGYIDFKTTNVIKSIN